MTISDGTPNLGVRAILVALGLLLGVAPARSQDGGRVLELLSVLETSGLDSWTVQRLARRPTRYRVVIEDGRPVVEATSVNGNAGLWRRVGVPAADARQLTWRWRIAGSIDANRRERERSGDDFAARVFAIFDAREGPWSGRALCYVWSAHLPVDTLYRSPYSDDVAMIVVEQGNARANRWMSVSRNLLRDYRRAFGTEPDTLAAVALMVDTDNTRLRATAWFDRLSIDLGATGEGSRTPSRRR